MFRKVLIANRGEIACRIAATLREMGIASVAVFSGADRGALHTRETDQAIEIGAADARASYLDVEALIRAARAAGAEAVHPGYGFLAENADFAAAVEAAGLVFIGPTADQIRTLGDKRAARDLAGRAGVAIVPGAAGNTPPSAALTSTGKPSFCAAAASSAGVLPAAPGTIATPARPARSRAARLSPSVRI